MQLNPKILVVDDEPAIVSLIAVTLRNAGFEVATAARGAEAVSVASSFIPDILLTDVNMEGMNGVEAAKTIVKLLPNCRVLILSAHPDSGRLVEQARAEGYVFPLITKPVKMSDLIRRLSQLLE